MAEGTDVRRRAFDRVVNFSDAVVAIAITLLVLPLVDSVVVDEHLDVGDLLHEDGSRMLAFLLSFLVIARFWLAHHRLFESIAAYNVALLWANLLWLLTIVWLPFPTEIIGGQGTADTVGRAVYIGSVLASSAMLLVLEVVIKRTPALRVDREHTDIDLLDAVATVITLVAALLIAVAVPVIGMWAMLLLVTTPWISGPIRRRRGGARASAA